MCLLQILAVDPPKELEEHGMETFKNFLRAEILPIFTRTTRRLEDVQVGYYEITLLGCQDPQTADTTEIQPCGSHSGDPRMSKSVPVRQLPRGVLLREAFLEWGYTAAFHPQKYPT